jgi:hypothetical protein
MELPEPINEDLINTLNQKIGRNLLRFQYIEFFLKSFLPYGRTEDRIKSYVSEDGIDLNILEKYEKKIQSKPLGHLIEEFKKYYEFPDKFFTQALDKVLAARNQLVHNFLEIPGVDYLSTTNGYNYAFRYLDDQFNEAYEFFEFTRHQSFAVLLAKLDTASENNPQAAQQYEQLIKILPSVFEIICPSDPSGTVWPNTRVVELLKLAELLPPKVGDMTLLSRAGEFIKSQCPDLAPKEYGLKTLTEVLLASGLFDIFRQGDGNNRVILYKSKS